MTNIFIRWKSNKSNFISSLLELPISANTLLIFEAINLQIYMLQKTWKQAFSLKGTEKIEPSKQQIRPLFEGQQGWWQKSRRVAFLLTNISSARTWIYCNIFHRHPVENLIPIKSLMAVFTWCRHLAMIPRQLAAITHFYQMACWELEKPWLNQPFCFQSSMAF